MRYNDTLMIDEDRTMQLFGYTSDELSYGSQKPIVRICEVCGCYKILQKKNYRELCFVCAARIPERCQKISEAKRGEKHPNWKGGITEWRSRLWYSHPYKAWRTAVFKRDKFTCQMCGDCSGGNLQAHHIQPVRDYKNTLLMFDINNGITLCEHCHDSICWHEHEFIDQFKDILGLK